MFTVHYETGKSLFPDYCLHIKNTNHNVGNDNTVSTHKDHHDQIQ